MRPTTIVAKYVKDNCEYLKGRQSELTERRQHRRVEAAFWARLKGPLLGTVTGEFQEMSVSGLSLTLDEENDFFS